MLFFEKMSLVLYKFLGMLNPSHKMGAEYEDEEYLQKIGLTSILTIRAYE